ncbi:MAG: MmcQ/YjbR family DNA-binding protein [Nocardioides sp.]|nr:MmcQ/YjbR family DNA-binding protein [Nocardioides sp.]
MTRRARVADVEAICRSLPEVELGVSWGDRPTYLVRQKPKPRGFVLARAPRHDAIDPETGEEYQDLLVIRTATPGDKAALVEDDGPFFTIDHFRNYNAVLLQQSRIGEIDVDELREVLTDAWLAVAPRALAKRFLAGELDG